MRYGISNWIYGDESLPDTFARLERLGYEAIELVGEPDQYSVDEINQLSTESGVAVTSVLGWCIAGIPGRDLANPDEGERTAAIRYGKACIDLAAEVGASYLVVIPAPAGRTAPIGTPDTQEAWEAAHRREWELAVDSVRQAARYAAERGVELALEPINRYETYLVTNLAEALAFINEVDMDNLHVHLDTFHMNIEESSPAEAILRAGDQLVNLHVADSNRETPGRGHLDFAGILNALQETGYEGVLALEPVPPGSDPLLVSQFPKNRPLRDIYAKEGIAYLKQIEANL